MTHRYNTTINSLNSRQAHVHTTICGILDLDDDAVAWGHLFRNPFTGGHIDADTIQSALNDFNGNVDQAAEFLVNTVIEG